MLSNALRSKRPSGRFLNNRGTRLISREDLGTEQSRKAQITNFIQQRDRSWLQRNLFECKTWRYFKVGYIPAAGVRNLEMGGPSVLSEISAAVQSLAE